FDPRMAWTCREARLVHKRWPARVVGLAMTECATRQPARAAFRQVDDKRAASPKVWTTRGGSGRSHRSMSSVNSTTAASIFSLLRLSRKLGSRYGASNCFVRSSAAANTRMLFIGTPSHTDRNGRRLGTIEPTD